MATDSANPKQIRSLAEHYTPAQLQDCMANQLQTGSNPCLGAADNETAMGYLAKAEFVRLRVNQGETIVEAMRELGRRMRMFSQGQNE